MNKKEIQERLTDLEGKEIFINCYGEKIIGVVSGADYYIGLTIQDKYDKNNYLLCINGQYSPKLSGHFSGRVWCEFYSQILEVIDTGILDFQKIRDLSSWGPDPSVDTCPFS